MKKSVFFFLTSLIVVSCDNTSDSGSADKSANERAFQLSGSYSDTLPCVDCAGILTELILYPDSSYIMRERYLGVKDLRIGFVTTSGRYTPENDWAMLHVMPSDNAENKFFSFNSEGGLEMLDSNKNRMRSGADYSLERQDKIVSRLGNQYIRYTFSPHEMKQVRLFSRVGTTDIVIDKVWLDQATEAEKAIVASYAIRYNSGCEAQRCALTEALDMDEAAVKTITSKWMPADSGVKKMVPPESKPTLNSLFVVKRENTIVVNCACNSDGDMPLHLIETYSVLPDRVELISSQTGNVQQRVILSNPNKPEKYPQGGKQIIDMKKVKEQQKKTDIRK